ncbi:MAG: hypothetical protein PHF67_01090 [Candidatus Nanoarchaeia archaeon]|nr:hypothetical protein [Candidatus Nanoarchaeia archaeon]
MILVIFLIIIAIALIWKVILTFVNEGTGEVSYKSDCLKTKLEILEANNNSKDNLVLTRGVGSGRLIGVKVFLNNQNIDTFPINLSEVEEKAFTIKNPLLRNNPDAVGKYVKIVKLVGNEFNNSKICEPDGKSAKGGVKVTDGRISFLSQLNVWINIYKLR